MTRDLFLKTQWNRYPAVTTIKNVSIFGRVYSVAKNKKSIEILRDDGNNFSLQRTVWVDDSYENVQKCPFEILCVGDIVAIDQENQLILLAPNLVITTSENWSYEVKLQTKKTNGLKLWSEYLNKVRSFFHQRGFIEVNTPILVEHPGSEPTIDVFKTELKLGKEIFKKYLPTSPELNLKKILTMGIPCVFELTKSFRNNENTQRHLPEFHILEWYRNYNSIESIKNDVFELISFLTTNFQRQTPQFEKISIAEVFRKEYGFDFLPTSSFEELKNFCQKQNLSFTGIDTIEDLFSLIIIEKIEPKLRTDSITCLYNYPPYAAALSRKTDEGWAERFEVYWKGLELANAFGELNDPAEQLDRFNRDNEFKLKNNLEPIEIDKDFLDSLRRGLPPCSGIALGLERLFMCITEIQDIREINNLFRISCR